MKRRTIILSPLVLAAARAQAAEPRVAYPDVVPGVALRFPRDHGSHPEFRTEWWYLTAQARDEAGAPLGVQITFFRSRPGVAEDLRSRFAPRQLLFAHAALALPARGRLLHDQRAAREGFGLAAASLQTTDLRIDDWSLARRDDGSYAARIAAREFTFDLSFRPTQPPLLQGEAGVSRKGPRAAQASWYYSLPHLAVAGSIRVERSTRRLAGIAWLDHEWSSEYLANEARGWDWTGINLADGGALMAFRIRDRAGGAYWAGGAHRDPTGRVATFGPGNVRFEPLRQWRSPRTNLEFPVAMRVVADALDMTLEPLLDDQELDARASVGTIYWEGAVRASSAGAEVGRGYLELTGYGAPLRL
jgi:predicted secreted hydrolase